MEDGHALPPGSLPAAAAAEQSPPHQAARGASASPPPANRQDKEWMKDLRGVNFKTAGGQEVQTDAKKMKRSQSKALLERCGASGEGTAAIVWHVRRTLPQLPAPQTAGPRRSQAH